jgi:hypothetical protein
MEELATKLQELGIEKKFSINKISKLIKQHEDRKQKSKELNASKPVNYELTAKMIWAKNHKALVDQYKVFLGATPITITKTIKGGTKEYIKYKVPAERKQEYSAWLLQQVQLDPNFVNFEQISHSNTNIQDKLNYVIDYLQTQDPPRYLTGEMKTYVRKMIKNGEADQQIFEYIIDISSRIPFGYLDPITRKITTKIIRNLPPPNGIAPIIKSTNKTNQTQSPVSPRQPAIPVTPKTPVPITQAS